MNEETGAGATTLAERFEMGLLLTGTFGAQVSVCVECGAIAGNPERHAAWHDQESGA